MDDMAIETRDLCKQYRQGVLALKELNIKIKHGHCVGYLGPNGSGKTTTIKILTNLLQPTSGQAFINGIDVNRNPKEALRSIGSLVEVPGMPDYLTAHELLAYFGKVHGMPKGELDRRITEVLATVKLGEWEHKKIGSFSTGMLRRLSLGKAFLHDPDILILDEPVIGMDPKGMKDIRDIIKGMLKEGKTIFLSSHLLGEVAETCTDVIFLEKGAVVSTDSVANFTNKAGTRFIDIIFVKALTDEQLVKVRKLDNISVADASGGKLRLEFDGKPETAASILSDLVAMKLGVESFTPQHATLEDVYVSSMGEERGVG